MDITFNLNAPSEVTVLMDHSGADAKAIYDILDHGYDGTRGTTPCLRVNHDGWDVFFGPMADMQAIIEEEGELSVRFVDWIGSMQDCFPTTYSFATSNSAMQVAIDTVTQAESLGTADLSGTLLQVVYCNVIGTPPTTGSTVGPFGSTMSALDVFQQCAAMASEGFEWYTAVDRSSVAIKQYRPVVNMAYVDPSTHLGVGANLSDGVDGLVNFGYGNDIGKGTPSNVNAVNVSVLPPLNTWLVEQNEDNKTSYLEDGGSPNYSVERYGVHGMNGGAYATKTIADFIGGTMLRADHRFLIELTADPTLAPVPRTDYFLGDIVNVNIQRDGLNVRGAYKVNRIRVLFDEHLQEQSHVVAFEAG